MDAGVDDAETGFEDVGVDLLEGMDRPQIRDQVGALVRWQERNVDLVVSVDRDLSRPGVASVVRQVVDLRDDRAVLIVEHRPEQQPGERPG